LDKSIKENAISATLKSFIGSLMLHKNKEGGKYEDKQGSVSEKYAPIT
jgi:hypothetical protein